MEKNAIDIITTVGFPIFCVIFMGWYIKEKDSTHSQEIKGFMDAIGTLTNKIDNLITKIDTLINVGGKNNE